jgi:hypothetical protein
MSAQAAEPARDAHAYAGRYAESLLGSRTRRFVIMSRTIKVAAVQAEPVWLDLDGTVDKTIAIMKKAASEGVELIAFPET